MRRRWGALPIVVVAVATLVACTPSTEPAVVEIVDQYRGEPPPERVEHAQEFDGGRDDSPYDDLRVSWLVDGTVAVTTWWSGSCPKVPSRLVHDHDVIVLHVEPVPAGGCTDDLAPTTSVISSPAGWPENAHFVAEQVGDAWHVAPRTG